MFFVACNKKMTGALSEPSTYNLTGEQADSLLAENMRGYESYTTEAKRISDSLKKLHSTKPDTTLASLKKDIDEIVYANDPEPETVYVSTGTKITGRKRRLKSAPTQEQALLEFSRGLTSESITFKNIEYVGAADKYILSDSALSTYPQKLQELLRNLSEASNGSLDYVEIVKDRIDLHYKGGRHGLQKTWIQPKKTLEIIKTSMQKTPEWYKDGNG